MIKQKKSIKIFQFKPVKFKPNSHLIQTIKQIQNKSTMINPRQSQPERQNLPLEGSRLTWSPLQSDIVIRGDSDISQLTNIKNTVLAIRREFQTSTDPRIQLNSREQFSKRLLLLQSQVQGLMRRKINFTPSGSQQSLDYTMILNEKQSQIVQLEKKIQNLEFQLEKGTRQKLEMENYIAYLNEELRVREELIIGKNDIILTQVAQSNILRDTLLKVRRNVDMNKFTIQGLDRIVFNQISLPQLGPSINPQALLIPGAQSRTTILQQQSPEQRLKTHVIQLFREVERIMRQQEGNITLYQMQRVLQGFILSQPESRLLQKAHVAQRRADIEKNYNRLRQNFALAAGIYQQNLQRLRRDNSNIQINLQSNLFDILQQQHISALQLQDRKVIFVEGFTEKLVQVPVEDPRNRELLSLLSSTLKQLLKKYPQLSQSIDSKLIQYIQQESISDVIQNNQLHKLVNIVKYVPQIVKVENVYAYSSQKSRKIQFHLRVLIKALLQQVEKMRLKTGVVMEIDEGILGMLRAQIMGVVNVDDILKVYRPVPKIVEVQKIVQKIVQKRVQIPMVVPITKQVEKIVQVQKIVQVEKIVNVPLQIPVIQQQIVQKIVPIEQIIHQVIQVPTIVQKIVYVNQQVSKVVQVPTIVQKIVQVQRIVEVQRVVNHIQQEPEQIQIIKQKIVPVQRIVQKIVQVPVVKEKIVERIVQVPKIEIIQKIVEKAVPVIQYRKALQVNNHIETIHKPVDRIVEKIVPVIRTIQRIVEVPQIIEKIVQVVVEKVEIREVEVVRQKLIKQEVIKPVEVIVKELVEVIREVPVQVQKIIEIPLVQEVIKKVTQIVEKPLIERVQNTVIKEVYLRDPMIVYQPKLVEVQKVVNHYVEVPKPVRYVEQRIVEIPRNVDRIKQVRVEVQKIIQKMVEVPKVIQVQKIVEKIVVVPRIIEKVIEVPQIIQKIVQKEIQKIVVRQVERQVQVPVIQQRIVQVEVIKNIYIQVEKPVDRVVDKLITITNKEEKVVTHQVKVQSTVEVISEVPKTLYIDKIVPAYHQKLLPLQIEKVLIVPRQIAVPVEVVVQKVVPVRQILEKIIQVPQFIQKIVETKQQNIKIQYIEKIIQKIVVDERIKEVQKIIPYMSEVIKQIPTIVQKIVTIQSKVQQIITAQQIVQKIVERSTTVPRIYQVQKIVPKLIKIPEIIEVQRIVPQIIRVNEYIQRIVEKVVEVPRIIEKIRQIQVERQKIIQVRDVESRILQVERTVEKIAILQQMKQVIKNVNHIERVVRIVQQIERSPVQVAVKEEILVEIPYILEKIVQKVVVMPQIVEVLKYVHEVAQNTQLLTVQNEKEYQEHEFKLIQLVRGMKPVIGTMMNQLRLMKGEGLVMNHIKVMEQFLTEFNQLMAFPKLVRIQSKQQQRVIQTQQRIVQMPVQSQQNLRKQISMSILIEKLIIEIKRLQQITKLPIELDDEVKMIFFPELNLANRFSVEGPLAQKFNLFAEQIRRKFESMGPWAQESQLMVNTILQQRFKLAEIIQSANMEIQRSKLQYENISRQLEREVNRSQECHETLNRFVQIWRQTSGEKQGQWKQLGQMVQDIQRGSEKMRSTDQRFRSQMESTVRKMEIVGTDEVYESKLREKDATIQKLKQTISALQKQSSVITTKATQFQPAEQQISTLQSQMTQLQNNQQATITTIEQSYRQTLTTLQQRNLQLEQENSILRTSLDNAQRELRVLTQNQGLMVRKTGQQMREVRREQQSHASFLGHSQIKQSSRLWGSQYSSVYPAQQELSQSMRRQAQQRQQSQLHLTGTPLDVHKYRSPLSTDIKQTQSFLRDYSISGQSPLARGEFTTPAREFGKQEGTKGEAQSQRQPYKFYYSPGQKKTEQKK